MRPCCAPRRPCFFSSSRQQRTLPRATADAETAITSRFRPHSTTAITALAQSGAPPAHTSPPHVSPACTPSCTLPALQSFRESFETGSRQAGTQGYVRVGRRRHRQAAPPNPRTSCCRKLRTVHARLLLTPSSRNSTPSTSCLCLSPRGEAACRLLVDQGAGPFTHLLASLASQPASQPGRGGLPDGPRLWDAGLRSLYALGGRGEGGRGVNAPR